MALKATAATWGGVYFVLVFAAGFVLGTLRVLLLEPQIGTRAAELVEMPLMLLVICFAARFVVGRMPSGASHAAYWVAGIGALVLLLLFEATLVLGLRDMSFGEYIESRDPFAFTAYIASLIVFAVLPGLLATRKIRRSS